MKMKLKFKKGQMPLVGTLIGLMVAVIVGMAVAIPVIQTQISAAGSIVDGSELSLNVTNGSVITLAHGGLLVNSIVIMNSTSGIVIPVVNYTVTLGTRGLADATVTFAYTGTNSSGVSDGTHLGDATYRYYGATYIDNRAVVALLQMIPLFLVLLMLMGAIALMKF